MLPFRMKDDSAHYSDQEIKSFISDIAEKNKPKNLDLESENEVDAANGEQPETNEPVAETPFIAPQTTPNPPNPNVIAAEP